MDAEALIGSLLRGTLTGRRKKGHGALRYLTGGSGSLLNAGTLLTAAGIAWGLFESAGARTTVPGAGGQWGGFQPGGGFPPVPPVPSVSQETLAPGGSAVAAAPEVLRIIRLIASAARADGALSEAEVNAILSHAREAGAEALVRQELQDTYPLPEIVGTVSDPQTKCDLYLLAFTIVHADQGVSGAERIYLAQLANLLGLDPDTTMQIERKAESGIAAASRP